MIFLLYKNIKFVVRKHKTITKYPCSKEVDTNKNKSNYFINLECCNKTLEIYLDAWALTLTTLTL